MFLLSPDHLSKKGNWILSINLFFFFLAYFVFGTGWYEPTKLLIHGQAATSKPAIQVRWDSGQGFNAYEQRVFHPKLQPLNEQVQSKITLGATGRRYPASLSKEVVCTAILVDGKAINLRSIAGKFLKKDGALHFKGKENISFTVQATAHIGLRFRINTSSGVAFMALNGKE
ncbi:MAG: hypothetical protein D3923_13095, partial [Candidatus Electrothrix sp. AR3]|nr:hypothetical protein [Candidatus Electrothrix sp. AR3]